MILGYKDKFKGTGLVAFIDILGFSKEIEDNWSSAERNPLEKLLELKENLPIISKSDLSGKDSSQGGRSYMCRVQTISDSIIVSFGFEDNIIYGDIILGTLAFFATISNIWTNALIAGFTVRGAADMGEIYWDEKEIIGPAFISSYKLEANHAKTSRIIISSRLNQNLKKICNQNKTFWNEEILKILRKDIDGYIILNPHDLYESETEKKDIVDILEKLKASTSTLTMEKYIPLLAALNSEKYNLREEDLGNFNPNYSIFIKCRIIEMTYWPPYLSKFLLNIKGNPIIPQ